MSTHTYPRVVVMYYDPVFDLVDKGPQEISHRGCAEIRGLIENLSLIGDRLSSALRFPILDDVVKRIAFDYEDYIHRVHSIRERSWDVVTGLTTHSKVVWKKGDARSFGMPKKESRLIVLGEIKKLYPDLHKAFERLQEQIELDIQMRNVATHQTALWIALMPGEHDAGEINDYDYPADGNERERDARKVVRRLLREFVAEQRGQIEAAQEKARDFVRACSTLR